MRAHVLWKRFGEKMRDFHNFSSTMQRDKPSTKQSARVVAILSERFAEHLRRRRLRLRRSLGVDPGAERRVDQKCRGGEAGGHRWGLHWRRRRAQGGNSIALNEFWPFFRHLFSPLFGPFLKLLTEISTHDCSKLTLWPFFGPFWALFNAIELPPPSYYLVRRREGESDQTFVVGSAPSVVLVTAGGVSVYKSEKLIKPFSWKLFLFLGSVITTRLPSSFHLLKSVSNIYRIKNLLLHQICAICGIKGGAEGILGWRRAVDTVVLYIQFLLLFSLNLTQMWSWCNDHS